MSLMIVDKSGLKDWVDAVMAQQQVIGPQAKGPKYVFARLTSPDQLRLDYNTTILPPKVALQPPEERLVEYGLSADPPIETVVEAEPTVLFGVHTCDLHAIRLLDAAFSSEPPDAHYLERRRQTTIVSLECLHPCDENCFCKDMGTLSADEGYDLHLTDIGEAYAASAATERGSALLEQCKKAAKATDEDVRHLTEVLAAKWPRFKRRLLFDSAELPSLLATAHDNPLWQELGERCFSCGSCTNVCPTCYCFNVTDEVNLEQTAGVRSRHWDSCQLDEFARVAGGESFRQARAARQRHRFMRKGKYLYEKYGQLGCVGCGRCIRTCLVHINIVDGFNQLYGTCVGGGER
jgi:sulfhydrogenase subunit beta (sulfur reductase)